MRNQDGRKTYYMGGKPYYGIPPKNRQEAAKPVKQKINKAEKPQDKKAEPAKKTVYDAAYISYVENGESAAVFIARDIAKDVPTVGKWIDVTRSDGYKNKNNRWDFKEFAIELFPRHKTPTYPKDATDEDKKYITWKTAHEDITEQRSKGVKGSKYVIWPKLVKRSTRSGKTKWEYEIMQIKKL